MNLVNIPRTGFGFTINQMKTFDVSENNFDSKNRKNIIEKSINKHVLISDLIWRGLRFIILVLLFKSDRGSF